MSHKYWITTMSYITYVTRFKVQVSLKWKSVWWFKTSSLSHISQSTRVFKFYIVNWCHIVFLPWHRHKKLQCESFTHCEEKCTKIFMWKLLNYCVIVWPVKWNVVDCGLFLHHLVAGYWVIPVFYRVITKIGQFTQIKI